MRTLISTFAVVCLLSWAVSAATITVDWSGGADYTTIADAVAAAGVQDTILVASGLYEESVQTSGKCLTIVGTGSGETIWQWLGAEPALTVGELPDPWRFTLSEIALVGPHAGHPVVRWSTERLCLTGCNVVGELIGGESRTHASIVDCVVDAVSATASFRSSEIISSTVGVARFLGADDYSHPVTIEDSEIGEVAGFGCYPTITNSSVDLMEQPKMLNATDCEFGSIRMRGGQLTLRRCIVNTDVTVWGFSTTADYYYGRVSIQNTLICGKIDYDVTLQTENVWAGLHLTNNTILGNAGFNLVVWDPFATVWPNRLRSNLVLGEMWMTGPWGTQAYLTVTHNDCMHGLSLPSAPGDSVFANFTAPPLFCGYFGGDYTLQECSPCAGAGHDGGDVGAFAVGCPCETPVEETSWGAIKSLFRGRPSN